MQIRVRLFFMGTVANVWLAKLYDRLMRFDKQIRFAAVVDGRGRILEGGMREGLEPIEPLEKTPQLIAKLVSILKAEDLDEFFGKPEYSILIHEKVIAFIFRSSKKFVLITTSRRFGVNKVGRLLNHVKK